MAMPKRKRRSLPTRPKRRTFVDKMDKHQIERVICSAARAEQLATESWRRDPDLPPVIMSAILRDLLICLSDIHQAGKNLGEAFLDRADVPAR